MERSGGRRAWCAIALAAALMTSSIFQLRVPAAQSEAGSTSGVMQRLAVIGDVRTSGLGPPPVFTQVAAQLEEHNPQVLLSVGDLINANKGANTGEQWAALKTEVERIGAQQFYPCLGNHDTNGSKRSLDEFRAAFSLPANAPGSLRGLAYSVDVGQVHLVCVSTEYPGAEHSVSDEQLNWLASDLAQSSAPYVFVFGHDPAFPVGPHVGDSLDFDPARRDRFWQILRDARVTAYIAGHEHLYHRQEYDGLTQVVLGSSGSDLEHGFGGEFVGYATIDVSDESMQVRVDDAQGAQRDAFFLLPRDPSPTASQRPPDAS